MVRVIRQGLRGSYPGAMNGAKSRVLPLSRMRRIPRQCGSLLVLYVRLQRGRSLSRVKSAKTCIASVSHRSRNEHEHWPPRLPRSASLLSRNSTSGDDWNSRESALFIQHISSKQRNIVRPLFWRHLSTGGTDSGFGRRNDVGTLSRNGFRRQWR